MASLGDTTSHILFCNSEGQMYYDYRPMVTLGAVCIMEDNGKIENSYASRAFRMGAEFHCRSSKGGSRENLHPIPSYQA